MRKRRGPPRSARGLATSNPDEPGPCRGQKRVDAFMRQLAVARVLEYLAQAVAEAEEAARWYAERSPTAATRFSLELDAAEAAIMDRPDAWPAAEGKNRRYLLRRFPFSVLYRVEESRIVIVAVAHARRRPNYWKHRKQRSG